MSVRTTRKRRGVRLSFAATGLALALAAPLCGAAGRTVHVAPGGEHLPPFADWPGASTNIGDAVALCVDGDEVLVTNGTYTLTGEVVVSNGVTVLGIGGASNTTIRGDGTARCFRMAHTNAVLEGFQIVGGRADRGAGILIDGAGVVRGCTIRLNVASGDGGGVHLSGQGAVENCLIVCNSANWGGGVYCLEGGTVRNSIMGGNRADADGGGVRCERGGTLVNCLIVTNAAGEFGGGVACRSGGTLRNCTVAANVSEDSYLGGVFCHLGGEFRNCVVSHNADHNVHDVDAAASFEFCAADPRPRGTGNTGADPLFVNVTNGNFRLLSGSPCIDAGTNVAGVGSVDLDGNTRVTGVAVDMGCYERALP